MALVNPHKNIGQKMAAYGTTDKQERMLLWKGSSM